MTAQRKHVSPLNHGDQGVADAHLADGGATSQRNTRSGSAPDASSRVSRIERTEMRSELYASIANIVLSPELAPPGL